jgi:hypothetical protein
VRVIDPSGNQGLSASLSYHAGVPSPVTYCTAKVNSLGCVPAIAFTGVPSASMTSGFVVRGANVRNNKNGLLFYGINGRSSLPFQGGTLCVKTPLRRTVRRSPRQSGPANDCSGVSLLDMNAFATRSTAVAARRADGGGHDGELPVGTRPGVRAERDHVERRARVQRRPSLNLATSGARAQLVERSDGVALPDAAGVPHSNLRATTCAQRARNGARFAAGVAPSQGPCEPPSTPWIGVPKRCRTGL